MQKEVAVHPDTPKSSSTPAVKCPPATPWEARKELSKPAPLSPSDWMRYRESRLKQFCMR